MPAPATVCTSEVGSVMALARHHARARPACRAPASSVSSPNAETGPRAPAPSTPSAAAVMAPQARISAVNVQPLAISNDPEAVAPGRTVTANRVPGRAPVRREAQDCALRSSGHDAGHTAHSVVGRSGGQRARASPHGRLRHRTLCSGTWATGRCPPDGLGADMRQPTTPLEDDRTPRRSERRTVAVLVGQLEVRGLLA